MARALLQNGDRNSPRRHEAHEERDSPQRTQRPAPRPRMNEHRFSRFQNTSRNVIGQNDDQTGRRPDDDYADDYGTRSKNRPSRRQPKSSPYSFLGSARKVLYPACGTRASDGQTQGTRKAQTRRSVTDEQRSGWPCAASPRRAAPLLPPDFVASLGIPLSGTRSLAPRQKPK